ncbi:unnamed protein product [Calypogeia fissa]
MSKRAYIGAYFAVAFISTTLVFVAEGLPIRGPDLTTCQPVIVPARPGADAVDCCFVDTGRPITCLYESADQLTN